MDISMSFKIKYFLWFNLLDKVLTWNHLQNRKLIGLGRCVLCKDDGESNNHIVVDCRFTKQLWKEVEGSTSLQERWNGTMVEECLRKSHRNKETEPYRSLQAFIRWSIQKARNKKIFEDKYVPTFFCVAQSLSTLSFSCKKNTQRKSEQ